MFHHPVMGTLDIIKGKEGKLSDVSQEYVIKKGKKP